MAKRVGFIGVGMMGNPMCKNLLQARFELTVWNRTESKNVKTPSPGGAMGGWFWLFKRRIFQGD